VTLPRWFRHHKHALSAPTHVRVEAGYIRLSGEAQLSADRLKQMVWRRWHRWPVVARPYIHKETIRIMGIKISWKPPTTRIDGTPVDASQFQSVIVAQLRNDGSGQYDDLPAIAGSETSLLVANPAPGDYAYSVRYVDVQGQQGASSADVRVTVPDNAPPPPPALLGAPTDVVAELVP
jgi:hypothetical protein